MNNIKGQIHEIKISGSLSLVSIRINENILLNSIVIETPESAPYLIKGNSINVIFKETEVVISKDKKPAISLQNRIVGTIKNIEQGELISRVILATEVGEIVAIISTNAVNLLDLKKQTEVLAMIKLNEIMLSR